MKIKTLLQSCAISYIDIVLISYYEPTSYHEPHYRQIDIEIRNRKDFYNFIASYGNSDVFDWTIESVEGIPYMIFDLENLVEKVQPKNKEELKKIIEETIEKEGFECDLNFIDTSNITDMSCLFQESEFNGDISKWDVSKVKNMELMFQASEFKGDISEWNVSNVEDMCGMFEYSFFNGDISKWDVSKVKDMSYMFAHSDFNGDISKWDISNVKYKSYMFRNCTLEINLPDWYKF